MANPPENGLIGIFGLRANVCLDAQQFVQEELTLSK